MIKVSVFYPYEKGKKFDKDYFVNSHMPLAEKAWGSALKKKEVDFGICGFGAGTLPAFTAVVHLYFDSLESFQSAYGPQHRELEKQASNFTDIKPIGQVSTIASSNMQDDSIEKKPSRTAAYVAYCRALAAKDERTEIRGLDSLAHLFVPEEMKRTFANNESIKNSIRVMSPIYGLLLARTTFFDSIFQKAVSEKIPQIVFLGAGYDTRAYRYHDLIKNTKIYELDISSTQNRKLDILRRANIPIPEHVKHVSINFKKDNLESVLKNSGYDVAARSLIIWEGVTYYLSENEFKSTIQGIKPLVPQGSLICFDYLTDERDSSNPAEPFRFWIDSKKLVSLLTEYGIKIIEHIDGNEMEKRYLTLSDGTLAENSLGLYCFVHGTI